jgi:hypothetical protein
MRPTRRFAGLLLTLGFIAACSGSPERLSISVALDDAVDSDAIANYIILASPSDSADSSMFPPECVSSSGEGLFCRLADCGFSADATTLDVNLPFKNKATGEPFFADGENVTVVICGYDSDDSAIAGGSLDMVNDGGSSDTLTLSDDVTSCGEIPPICS